MQLLDIQVPTIEWQQERMAAVISTKSENFVVNHSHPRG
jgi:hypothetical protein